MASTMMSKDEVSLNQSIQQILDHMDVESNFHELIHRRAKPHLETIWVFAAINFRSRNSPKDEPLNRLEAIKDLFGSLSAFSVSSSSSESIALMAPVLYELHSLHVDLKSQIISSKAEKNAMRGINSLVASILAFISICCSGDHDEKCLIRPVEDLVRVWLGGEEAGGSNLFFPLLSDGIIQWLGEEDNGIGKLAGAVIMEAFLLRFCLDLNRGSSKLELQKDLTAWSISSITGLHHVYFFDILLRTLLDQTLPVTSLLKPGDEIFLRKILYDAVILPSYSFDNHDNMKNTALARLIVTHEAVEIYRRNGDQEKAISYINAFSSSNLPYKLIKLVKNEMGLISKVAKPIGSSPKAFLEWLLKLEDQGLRLFDDRSIESQARLAMEKSKSEEQLDVELEDGDLFYVDKEGEEEEDENGSGRKRKQERKKGNGKKIKFTKYNLSLDSEVSEKKLENVVSDDEDNEED